ncbi:Endothelin-converting enzyme 1 [Bulinus truncatus]|nr:Endothelin-converting enzyme 1 [Bulinus truncatus]
MWRNNAGVEKNRMSSTSSLGDKWRNGTWTMGNFWIDGEFTLDENIADNGGLRAAMFAYQLWIDEFGEERHVAGVNMTMYQVFYTSFAQMYCSKWTDAGLFYHLLTDPHSPGSARVNGALSNSQTFNWAFQCEMAKPMNPRTKCEVW